RPRRTRVQEREGDRVAPALRRDREAQPGSDPAEGRLEKRAPLDRAAPRRRSAVQPLDGRCDPAPRLVSGAARGQEPGGSRVRPGETGESPSPTGRECGRSPLSPRKAIWAGEGKKISRASGELREDGRCQRRFSERDGR